MNKGNIMSVEPHLFPELHEESVGLLMEAGKEWGVGNHMLCIYSGVSQIMETSVSQQSLGELSPPSSETGLQTSHFLTPLLGHWPFALQRDPLWRAWKEPTKSANVPPNIFYLCWFLPFIFTLLPVSEGTGNGPCTLLFNGTIAPIHRSDFSLNPGLET